MESSIKVNFEKFDGNKSLSIWKVRVEDQLIQHELDLVLEERPDRMMDRQ